MLVSRVTIHVFQFNKNTMNSNILNDRDLTLAQMIYFVFKLVKTVLP